MPGPRAKILSVITIPTAGWELTINITDGVQFNTPVNFTMAAGDYYMSGDMQSDDFLYEFMSKAYTALGLSGVVAYDGADKDGKPILWINTNHKVNFAVGNSEDMQIDWTDGEGPEVAKVLGFDHTGTSDYTGTTIVGDYHHAYGWYSYEDGLLRDYAPEDWPMGNVLQSTAPSGHVKTTYLATVYRNEFTLDLVQRDKMFSDGVSYEDTPSDPYERNEPLECWFHEAIQGKAFRFYEYNQIDFTLAKDRGVSTASTTTTITDANKAWDQEPFEHKEESVGVTWYNSAVLTWYISSHTNTVLTVAGSLHNTSPVDNDTTYYIFNRRYKTYVLDVQGMAEFRPAEIGRTDRFSITVPVKRYL